MIATLKRILTRVFFPPINPLHYCGPELTTFATDPVVTMCDGQFVTRGDLASLQYHLTMGVYHRERMEAAAAQCCEILGVDPHEDSIPRDWCNEIVYHGTDPALVIQRINQFRSQCAS